MLRTGPLNLSLSLSFGALQAWRLTSSIFHTHSSAGSLPSTWFIYLFFYIFTYFHVPCDSSVYFVCTTCFLSSVRPTSRCLEWLRHALRAALVKQQPALFVHGSWRNVQHTRASHQGERASSYANALSWLQISGERAPPAGISRAWQKRPSFRTRSHHVRLINIKS